MPATLQNMYVHYWKMKVQIGKLSEYKKTIELNMKCGFGERRNQTIFKKDSLQSASVSCLTIGYVHLATQTLTLGET